MAVVSEEDARGEGCCKADLVAWELVDASAIAMVEPTMFAVGRGFAVPEEGKWSAIEVVKIAKRGAWSDTCPLITIQCPRKSTKALVLSLPTMMFLCLPIWINLLCVPRIEKGWKRECGLFGGMFTITIQTGAGRGRCRTYIGTAGRDQSLR